MEEEKKSRTGTKKKTSEGQSMNQSVLQLFSEAIQQRRQQGFERLRNWDQQRAQKINDYRTVCESIVKQLETRMEVSLAGFDGMIKFFTERKRQEEFYCSTMTKGLPHLADAFQDPALKPPNTWSLPKLFKESDDFHQKQCKASQSIAAFIDQKILKGLIDSQKSLAKLFQSFKDEINELRKEMNSSNAKMKKKAQKYASMFSEIMKNSSSAKKKDPYNKELALMACAQKQVQDHQKFGKQIVSIWENAHKTEIPRYQTLKQTAILYLNKMTELYGKSFARPEVPLKSFETFNPDEEVVRIYNIGAIVEPNDANIIKKEMGVQQLNFKIVKDYLTELSAPKLESNPLVLKEWTAKREGGILKSYKTCQVVITVDGNLLLVDRSDGNAMKKADTVIKMERMKVKPKGETEVEIIETKPGFLLDSSTKYTVKFETRDQVEELLHQIKNTKG